MKAGMKRLLFLLMFISLWTGIASAQGRDRSRPISPLQPRLQPGVRVHKDLAYVPNGHDRQKPADLTQVCIDPALADSPSAMLLGGSGPGVGELARKASPIMHVSEDDPPFLIMHGDEDGVVPLDQSRAFAKALKAAGVKVNLVILKGAGHGGGEFLQPDQVKVIDAFLNENLGRRKTAGSH